MPPWQPRTRKSSLRPEADRGGDAVGGAGGDGDRIGEEHGVRIEDQVSSSSAHRGSTSVR